MPAEHGGTASPFLPQNEGDEHPQLQAETNNREVPHPPPHHTAPTKASLSPPGPPRWGQTLLAPWYGSGSSTPGRRHPPLPPKLYLHRCCQEAALRKTREKQHSVGALEPGGTAGTGGSGGRVWRGRCLGLASLEHLLPALHARLLFDVLPPVTNITEVLLLGEGWVCGCKQCPRGTLHPSTHGKPHVSYKNPVLLMLYIFLGCTLLFQYHGCQRRQYGGGKTLRRKAHPQPYPSHREA